MLDSNEEYVSLMMWIHYSILLGENTDFTLDENSKEIQKKLELFCKKSVSKKLLNELCKGCNFLADGRLMRQVEGYPMGGLIPVVLSNIFCVKMKPEVVKPLKQNITNVMTMIFTVNRSRIKEKNVSRN